MANIADTIYRIYGSNETLEIFKNKVVEDMRLCDLAKMLGCDSVEGKYIRGEVRCFEDTTQKGGFFEICADTAWSEQSDFIHLLEKRFEDDESFYILWQCEEPGCGYYVTNVEGGLYGKYLWENDYAEMRYYGTFGELADVLTEFFSKNGGHIQPPSHWETVEQMEEYCDKWNEENEDDYAQINVHEFETV